MTTAIPATTLKTPLAAHLRRLEAESIFIMREAVAAFRNPRKDSSVMLHIARKAFFPGKVPFPLLHVDTTGSCVENIRRIGEVAKLFVDAGVIVLCAFISPFRTERRLVRELLQDEEFVEIFVYAPLEECMRRDPRDFIRKPKLDSSPTLPAWIRPTRRRKTLKFVRHDRRRAR